MEEQPSQHATEPSNEQQQPAKEEVNRRVHAEKTFDSDDTLQVYMIEVMGAESRSISKVVVTQKKTVYYNLWT